MQVALVNLAHIGRSPIRKEGAALRILGLFPNEASLRSHAQKYYDTGIDLICIPVSKWFCVFQHSTGLKDEMAHLQHLSTRYKEYLASHEEEFMENYSCRQTGKVSASDTEHQPQYHEQNALDTDLIEPDPVPRSAEIRQQACAIISILPDFSSKDTSLQEPAVIIWGVCADEESAKKYIKEELSMKARDVHLDVVLLYEWLPLTGLNLAQITEEYRDETLTSIMKNKKNEAKTVKEYRDLCEQVGQEPSVLEVSQGNTQELQIPRPLDEQSPINLVEQD